MIVHMINDRGPFNLELSNVSFGGIGARGSYGAEGIKGVVLSREWLERLGFKQDGEKDEITGEFLYKHNNRHHLYGSNGLWIYRVPGVSLVSIQYVHQLQNIFYMLTGKECSI